MATFSERLKQLREEKNKTLGQMAEDLNTTKASLSRYENDMRKPKMDFTQEIADYFNVSIDYLLGRTDIRQPEKNNETIENIRQALEDTPDLLEFFDEMAKRKDLQMFAKQCRELSPSTIKRLMKISKIFEEEERERHGG